MTERDRSKGKSAGEEGQATPAGDFTAMERLGRSFLEKNEQTQADLKALRDMHRRRTREKPEDPSTE